MKKINILIIVFILGLISCAKDIIDLTCTIEGIVKDKNTGMPLANCEVQITPLNNSITTARDGVYSFNALEPGEYTLTFNRSGYISDSRTVSVKASETSRIEMLLEAKANFSLSENVYDFGDLETNKTFVCFNNSADNCSYTITNLPEWILANKTQGTIKASSNDSFTLTIDRSKVGIGNHNQNIIIEYSGKETGTETLLIKMSKVKLTTPTVTTAYSATSISEYSFDIEGTITATGGAQITSYGHCWSTEENPTIDGQCTNLGMTNKIGTFKSTIENLSVNTTYYVRAYATNSQGTAYGEQIIVKTSAANSDIWDGQIAKSFAGGSGTITDPYIIKTGGQLLLMKEYEDENFKLDNDINLNNNNWLPFYFSGYLNGNGHTIYNLKISRNTDNQGLFSQLNGTIENLKINGVDIKAPQNSNIGALAGYAYTANISNCHVFINNTIFGEKRVGGLVGLYEYEYNTLKINDCTVTSSTTGLIKGDREIGGLVGRITESYSDESEVRNNHVEVNIEGGSYIGGCYGYLERKIKLYAHSYKGKIKGQNTIGGICGLIDGGRIEIVASKADVNIEVQNSTSKYGVGGILGDFVPKTERNTINSCYTTGTISFDGYYGGIVDSENFPKMYLTTIHCYTTIYDNIQYNDGHNECTSVYETNDVSQTMFGFYSKYAEYWNYKNIWLWNGVVDGRQVSIPCPKLSWEE